MNYQIEKEENVGPAIRRIVREQLEKALRESAAIEFKAVHSVRKRIKKIRAVLRLVKGTIGAKVFREENQRLRAAAHCFSEMRDAGVQLGVLEELRKGAGLEAKTFSGIARFLTRQKRAAAAGQRDRNAEARALLEALGDRLEGWALEALTMPVSARALEQTYRKARGCLACVTDERTPENFHSWRKHTKNVWYQARLLQELNPEVMGEICDAAGTLADRLGDLHDFAFLRERLQSNASLPKTETDLLFGLISQRERTLEEVVLDLGGRFFAEKPGAFGRRLARYAKDWDRSAWAEP